MPSAIKPCEWVKTPVRVLFVAEYYTATQTTYVKSLRSKGLSDMQIGVHGGTADTATFTQALIDAL